MAAMVTGLRKQLIKNLRLTFVKEPRHEKIIFTRISTKSILTTTNSTRKSPVSGSKFSGKSPLSVSQSLDKSPLSVSQSLGKSPVSVSQSSGKDILLFSYMRSGSTVTGNLLRDSPGVFFMFEPLSPLAPYSYFTDRSICEMRNSTCRSENVHDRIEVALTAMVNLYSCNMKAVPISLIDKMVAENKSGEAWQEFGECLNGTKTHSKYNDGEEITRMGCFDRFEQACRSADFRVAKVLRLGFATIETLLKRIPSLKVLYLARDPRAIINSRIKTVWFPVFNEKPRTVFTNILGLCLKMETDIQDWKHTRDIYGDRILHTTLTKIASRINAMLEIFKFMNKTVTVTEERNIISYLYKNQIYNITENWRSELSSVYRKRIEDRCYYVIEHITSMDSNTV
ncbi:uncharacterized protein LOC123530801 [Mercenaria mercenaria]|uniref:uncharacterized protein LOC123530801 n=1 Tax=Mercenaria mercenaria TaxID=6596 RepID=UPI00234F8453|nr:uncharacterized protein LOC123530801 [Mercenaria mercenaria]